jgi:hypothetical protein
MKSVALALLLSWGASAEAPQKPVLGTVAKFRMQSLEIGVQADDGKLTMVKIAPETEVVQVPPGELDLKHAKPAAMTDLTVGDRVLVSYAPDMKPARRIVVVSATEIAKRNEAVRLDWQQRGISGVVSAKNGKHLTIEQRSPGSVKTLDIGLSDTTKLRRYSADSVKFTEAEPARAEEIAVGDQLKARGSKDGEAFFAEELVFGTFLTKVGKVTEIDRDARLFRMEDSDTKAIWTVKIAPSSRLRNLAGARPTANGEHGGPPPQTNFDLAQMLDRMPEAKLEDLKVGNFAVLTSTRGSKPNEVTAIMVLANADFLIQMAMMQAGKGVSVSSALGGMHDGMLGGPSGVSLPALIP